MNWTALVVVTGLTTLYFIIQYVDYVANHRQYDPDLGFPPVLHPVNQPSSASVGAASSATDDAIQPAVLSSPPCRHHRGLGFSVDARSDDDDCSSYSPTSSGQSDTTQADDSRNLNNACSRAHWPDANTDGRPPIAPMSPSDTVNSGSIDCASGPQNFDGGIRQMAYSSSGDGSFVPSPCRSFEERTASSHNNIHDDHTLQSRATPMTPPSAIGRRVCADVIEILTTPISDDTPEAAAAADDAHCEPSAGQSNRQEERPRDPLWLRLLRWVDRVVGLFVCISALIELIQWMSCSDPADPSSNERKSSRGNFW